jgi:hypothetical protein
MDLSDTHPHTRLVTPYYFFKIVKVYQFAQSDQTIVSRLLNLIPT